jgi:hypothetical protein
LGDAAANRIDVEGGYIVRARYAGSGDREGEQERLGNYRGSSHVNAPYRDIAVFSFGRALNTARAALRYCPSWLFIICSTFSLTA